MQFLDVKISILIFHISNYNEFDFVILMRFVFVTRHHSFFLKCLNVKDRNNYVLILRVDSPKYCLILSFKFC